MSEIIIKCPSPNCGIELRVPDKLRGTPVRCPKCRVIFTAQLGDESVEGTNPPSVPSRGPQPSTEADSGRRARTHPEGAEDDERTRVGGRSLRSADDSGPGSRRSPRSEHTYEDRSSHRRRQMEEDDDWDEDDRPLRRRRRPYDDDADSQKRRARMLLLGPAIGLLATSLLGILMNVFRIIGAVAYANEGPDPEMPEILREMGSMPPGIEIAIAGVLMASALIVILGAIQMLRLKTYWLAITGSVVAVANITCGCCFLALPFSIWALVVLFQPPVREAFD